METTFKIQTLRDCATDELIEKVNALTDPTKIKVVDYLLNKTFGELTYLDSTCFRDIFDIDINWLIKYFN
jgi:hypothetical protein